MRRKSKVPTGPISKANTNSAARLDDYTWQETRVRRRLLRIDLLRPGDVILSTEKAVGSQAIALLSNHIGKTHRFSHAMLVQNDSRLFEAVDHGLISRSLYVSNAGTVGGRLVLVQDVSGYSAFEVWRHPALENLEVDRLNPMLQPLLREYRSKEYPPADCLAKAAARLAPARTVVALALKAWDRADKDWKPPETPGPFCSMLVAAVLDSLLQKLFGDGPDAPRTFSPRREPVTVSPNSLASESCLTRVKAATSVGLPDFVNQPEVAQKINRALFPSYRGDMSLSEAIELEKREQATLVKGTAGAASARRRVNAILEQWWLDRLSRII
jgi:hypothetical protein